MTSKDERIKFNKIKFLADLDNVTQLKDKLTNDLNTKNNILKLKEDENAKFRLENAKIVKSREILMKKIMTIDVSKIALENEILKLKYEIESALKIWYFKSNGVLNVVLFNFPFRNIISTFEKEREQTKKSIELAKKHSDGLIRERDLVRKDLVKCNSKINFFFHLFEVLLNSD